MQRTSLCLFAFSVALLNVPLAVAQADGSPDIVVTAERLRETAQSFVSEIAEAPAAEDQLARWNDRVCIGAVGLAPESAQHLVDRISHRAEAVGLRAGEPGCQANVMVIYAPDSDTLTRQIVDQRRDLLGYYTDEGVVTAGRGALEAFASTPRAIRWWHVAQTTSSDGQALGNSDSRPGRDRTVSERSAETTRELGEATSSIGTMSGVEGVRSSGSRLTSQRNTRQDLNYVLIIVDASRVGDAPWTAWMDYVAMVALAQIDPDAAPREVETVLNLFSAPEQAPAEMSPWDIAYIDALYRATRTAVSSRTQGQEMARMMAETIEQSRD